MVAEWMRRKNESETGFPSGSRPGYNAFDENRRGKQLIDNATKRLQRRVHDQLEARESGCGAGSSQPGQLCPRSSPVAKAPSITCLS